MSHITFWEAIAIFVGLGLWFAFVIWGQIAYNNFRVRIQLSHPDLWASLGKPEFSQFTYPGHAPHALLARFLWRRRYRAVGDSELTRLGDRAFLAQGLFFVLVAAVAVKFLMFP
jgi:hypothetical protein